MRTVVAWRLKATDGTRSLAMFRGKGTYGVFAQPGASLADAAADWMRGTTTDRLLPARAVCSW